MTDTQPMYREVTILQNGWTAEAMCPIHNVYSAPVGDHTYSCGMGHAFQVEG